jgi:hypothetical protein
MKPGMCGDTPICHVVMSSIYQNLFQSRTGVAHSCFTSGIGDFKKWEPAYDRVSHIRKKPEKSVLIMTKECT